MHGLRWYTMPAGTHLFRGFRPEQQGPAEFRFASEFATALLYAEGEPSRLQVIKVRRPLKLLIMDRPNMQAISDAAAAGQLPLLLAYSMAQVTGYGVTGRQYYRDGRLGSEANPGKPRDAYGILTHGQLAAHDGLYAAGRLAELVCRHLGGAGWIYPPLRLRATSPQEYAARRRLAGGHFHDEVMICAAALAERCSVGPLKPSAFARLAKGWPGPDPAKLWVDDWKTHEGFADSSRATTAKPAPRKATSTPWRSRSAKARRPRSKSRSRRARLHRGR